MANVTTGKNFPTPYDLRMEGLRKTPGISPASAKPTANIGGIGGLFRKLGGPVLTSLDVVNRLRKGENPADVVVSTAGGLAGGAAGAVLGPLGAIGGYAAGSSALPPVVDWLGKNAVLSDRWTINKSRPQAPQMFGPAYGNVSVPSGGLRNSGPDYKNRELAAGQAAENFRTGAGFPGQSPAAERAYQQQLSSTAQQVAQDPQLDAWSKQRALDVASKDYSKSEDMGMRIWAEKHGKLAKQVKPGQAGYDVIQQVLHGTSQQPAAQPNYTNAFSVMPDLQAYSNSMPNAIVRAPGDMPTFAMDDPRFGDYNSTANQAYNLVNSLASRTTEGTLSLPWGEINRIGGSSEAGGIYPGAPLKLPVPPTQLGSPGYPALTADNLLPTVDVSRAFTANGMDPKFRAFANAMYKNN